MVLRCTFPPPPRTLTCLSSGCLTVNLHLTVTTVTVATLTKLSLSQPICLLIFSFYLCAQQLCRLELTASESRWNIAHITRNPFQNLWQTPKDSPQRQGTPVVEGLKARSGWRRTAALVFKVIKSSEPHETLLKILHIDMAC